MKKTARRQVESDVDDPSIDKTGPYDPGFMERQVEIFHEVHDPNLPQKAYLGDYDAVETVVKFWVGNAIDKLQTATDDAARMVIMKRSAQKVAYVFLGHAKANYIPIRNWNVPGAIDRFMAKWMGSSEKDPDVVMEHCFIIFFDKAVAIARDLGNDKLPEYDAVFAYNMELMQFCRLLLGVDLPTQAMMDF